MSVMQIQEQIKALSDTERSEITEWILQSAPHEEDDAYLQETIALAERRSEELRSGKVKAVSWEEVQKRLDEALPA